MLQQKYVYVYMLVVLGMALLAVNNSTLRTQPGQQSMRVTFEQEFESIVVSVSAPVSAPSQSVPTAAMVTVKIEPTQKNVRPNPYDAVRGAGKRDNNKKHASSSTSNSTNNTTRSSVGGTDADRGTPSSSSSTGTNKKKKKTKSSLPPTTYWHNNQTRVVNDIEYRRIPTWMKEYFDWHRLQTTTMNQTNWYHENRKYLIIRCLRGERCGGLSDRIKPMPGEFGLRFDSVTAHKKKHTSFWYFLIFLIYLITRFFISLCSPGRPYPSDPDDSLDQVRYYINKKELRYERDYDDGSI